MATPNGNADETTIYAALVVEEYTDASWNEYLRGRSRADDGRTPAAGGDGQG